jgi:hypothetical protein
VATPDEYLARAADCVGLAQNGRYSVKKLLLLEMAQAWVKLAGKSEERARDGDPDDNKREKPAGA